MEQLRGVLAIPPAVYREDLSVDYEGVSRTVDFCLRCGVHNCNPRLCDGILDLLRN